MSGAKGWTWEENKTFETAMATHWEYFAQEQWDKIASMVPSKTADEVKKHYQKLVDDVKAIEAGLVPTPRYSKEVAKEGRVDDSCC
ncbi:hypothetical protein L1049_010834 [Liquidambar formosana]|uniref:Myb-like domain-containing protein n=1 Tax=Liquidambar formosana TaxID=63359 RepID=A0AAP0RVT5_LIQFO